MLTELDFIDEQVAVQPRSSGVVELRGDNAQELGHQLVGLLQVRGGWEGLSAEQSTAQLFRPSTLIQVRSGVPLADALKVRVSRIGTSTHKWSFGGNPYYSFDPDSQYPVLGEDDDFFPAGVDVEETAFNAAEKLTATDPYFAVSLGEEITGDPTTPFTTGWTFTVLPKDPEVRFEHDWIELTFGFGSDEHTSGGFYKLQSGPVTDSDGVIMDGSLTVWVTSTYRALPSGVPSIWVTLKASGSVDTYREEVFASAGNVFAHAGTCQFALWRGSNIHSMLASVLRPHAAHSGASACGMLIVGSDNGSSLGSTDRQLDTRQHWDLSIGCGLGDEMHPITFHSKGPSNAKYRCPTVIVRGLRHKPMWDLADQPLVHAPWVYVTPDPNTDGEGFIGGMLWDMLVMSDAQGTSGDVTFDGVSYSSLSSALGVNDIMTGLWISNAAIDRPAEDEDGNPIDYGDFF